MPIHGHTIRERKLIEIAERKKKGKLTPAEREAAARVGEKKKTPTATQNPPFSTPTSGSTSATGKKRRFLGLEGPFTAREILKKKKEKAKARKR